MPTPRDLRGRNSLRLRDRHLRCRWRAHGASAGRALEHRRGALCGGTVSRNHRADAAAIFRQENCRSPCVQTRTEEEGSGASGGTGGDQRVRNSGRCRGSGHVSRTRGFGYLYTVVAHEMGQKLGYGAHLASLRRTTVAEFAIEDAQHAASAGSRNAAGNCGVALCASTKAGAAVTER